MAHTLKRREFLVKGSHAGIACCAFLLGAHGIVKGNMIPSVKSDPVNPKDFNYCGYKCPVDCKMLLASQRKDTLLKREAFKDWKIKEKYSLDFDNDALFCYGCKNRDMPEGIILKNCTVRQCVISREFDCCIECVELTYCDKDLWKNFPDFHEAVIGLQRQMLSQ
jgi:hypothetical protein